MRLASSSPVSSTVNFEVRPMVHGRTWISHERRPRPPGLTPRTSLPKESSWPERRKRSSSRSSSRWPPRGSWKLGTRSGERAVRPSARTPRRVQRRSGRPQGPGRRPWTNLRRHPADPPERAASAPAVGAEPVVPEPAVADPGVAPQAAAAAAALEPGVDDLAIREPVPPTPAPSAPAPVDEASAIRNVIATYEQAIEGKDLELYRSVKPNLSR